MGVIVGRLATAVNKKARTPTRCAGLCFAASDVALRHTHPLTRCYGIIEGGIST